MKLNLKKMILTGSAALGLALMTSVADAQPIQLKPQQLTNTALGTAYYQTGGSNVVVGSGYVVYQGGTNSITLTNGQSRYVPATSKPFSLAFAQNVPVWWALAVTSVNGGTSNTVVGLDLTADGVYWTSNSVTATIACVGTGTNTALAYFPLTNGTNVFSGWSQARWSFASTAQLTNVTLLQNRLQVVR